MKIYAKLGISNHRFAQATARCPHCRKEAVLEPIGEHDYGIQGTPFVCGQRRCPNPECRGHVFAVFQGATVVALYPPSRIDFDPEGIPTQVVRTFEEAITCRSAECFVAAAIMVRRTLEEVCADRGAAGATLKERLKELRSKNVPPQDLLGAMDELRLLGNDAAHLEAREYANVSQTEVEVAIEFTKEFLKGLYQYPSLLGRLRALKRT